MKTTELFAEQVLIGLLALSTVGIILYKPLDLGQFFSSEEHVKQIVTGGFIIAAAYLIGMVYDRVADTLLQDLESHARIQFALRSFKERECGVDRFTVPPTDPFEEGKYRLAILENGQATDYMNYLRSRIRLTRAMTTVVPGLTLSLILAKEYNKDSARWIIGSVLIAVVYAAVLFLKSIKRFHIFKRPPKTYQLQKLEKYMNRACMVRTSRRAPRHIVWLLIQDELWLGILVLVVLAFIPFGPTNFLIRLYLVLAGLVLTILVGWTWWRILMTFYAFLRDYQKYSPSKAAVAKDAKNL